MTTSDAHSETGNFTTVSVMLRQLCSTLLLRLSLSHMMRGVTVEKRDGSCSGLLLTHGNGQELHTCGAISENQLGEGVGQVV